MRWRHLEGLGKIGQPRALLPLAIVAVIWGLAHWPGGRAMPRPAEAFVAAGSASDSCAACHRMEPMFSHPVGVAPSMAGPAELPLEDGRVACLTCHANTDWSHAAGPRRGDPMLRMSVEGGLCIACHGSSGVGAKMMHPRALGRAHLMSPVRPGAVTGLSLLAEDRSLDSESHQCVSCHDGTVAADAGHDLRSGSGSLLDREHPVGVLYGARPRVGPAAGDMPVVPAGQLDQRIRLFDQRVGCGSCHSPYSQEKNYLVMSNRGSRLCLSCHGGQ